MARKIRLMYPGAVYHVMCRGDRREAIFLGDDDRRLILDTLAEACGRSGMRVHSYVLMTNHYHLLLETPEANLVEGMRWFQGTYTARFNARHHMSGHLFQGRYKAVPVDPEAPEYFRRVSDYIHLNPARAGVLPGDRPRLSTYPWSSFRGFAGAGELPTWLVRRRVFEAHDLPDEAAASRRRYAALLARRAAAVLNKTETEEQQTDWAQVRQGWHMGEEDFRRKLEGMTGAALRGRRRESFQAEEPVRQHDLKEAERLLLRMLPRLGARNIAQRPANDPAKQVLAWMLRSRTTAGGAWIAERLAMGHVSNVSRAYRAVRNAGHDTNLSELRDRAMHICKD